MQTALPTIQRIDADARRDMQVKNHRDRTLWTELQRQNCRDRTDNEALQGQSYNERTAKTKLQRENWQGQNYRDTTEGT